MTAQAKQQASADAEEKAKLKQSAEELKHANQEAAKKIGSLTHLLEEEKATNAALVQKEESLKKDSERSSKEAVQRESDLRQCLQEAQDANKALLQKEEGLKADLQSMQVGKADSMQREAKLQESLMEAQEANKLLAKRATEADELRVKANSSSPQAIEESVTDSRRAEVARTADIRIACSPAKPSASEQKTGDVTTTTSSSSSSSSSSSCASHDSCSSKAAPPTTPGLHLSCAVCPQDADSASSDSPEKKAASRCENEHAADGSAVSKMDSSQSSTSSYSQDSESESDDESMRDDHEAPCLCLLTTFLPGVLPRRPALAELEGFAPDAYSVCQLASPGWHHRCLAVLEEYGIPWKSGWQLLPAFFDPEGSVYTMRMQSLGEIGKGDFGAVHYAQKWVGPSPEYDGSEGWETGFIPVGVKVVRNDACGQQEMRSLSSVTQAMAKRPGPCHVVQFEGAFPYRDEATQTDKLYIATRYVEGSDMQQAFDDLYNLLVMSPAGDELKQQDGERMYVAAVKEAFKQLLKGLEVMHSCGLAHLDLKLNNVRVRTTTDGSQLHLTIIDLGSAQDKPVDCGEVRGNIGYLSPEGIDLCGEPEGRLVGTPSDMWTVGCLMLEVLAGEPAFMDRQMICKPYEQQADHITQRQRRWAEDCKKGAQVPCGLQDLEQLVADSSELQLLKDFLQQLLQVEPSQRLTASQALSHKYFSRC